MMVPANRSRSAMVLQRLGLLACLAGAAGCATAGFANRGVQAEQAGDFDLAVVEYTRAAGSSTPASSTRPSSSFSSPPS